MQQHIKFDDQQLAICVDITTAALDNHQNLKRKRSNFEENNGQKDEERSAQQLPDSNDVFQIVENIKKRVDLKLFLEHLTEPIKLSFIKELILWILADGLNQRWILVKNRLSIGAICLILTDNCVLPDELGISSEGHGGIINTKTSSLLSNFDVGVNTICGIERSRIIPPSELLLRCSITSSNNVGGEKRISIEQLLMTEDLLKENNYQMEPKEGYLSIHSEASNQKTSYDLLALDCEMVTTAMGTELARISLVDINFTIIYDKYVKPANIVTDYLTQYNGITAETLANITLTLKQVQQELSDIIHAKTILVGHSLENDLAALQIIHTKIIDTSIIYKHPKYPDFKHSLKHITKKYLKRTIQDGSHDSVEDAKACMELLLLKMKYGPSFGCELDKEWIWEKLDKAGKTTKIINSIEELQQGLSSSFSPSTSASTKLFIFELDAEHKGDLQHAIDITNKISSIMPKSGLVLLVNGCNRIERAEELFERRSNWYRNKDDSWDDQLEISFNTLCNEIRKGFCLIKLQRN